MKTKSYVKPFCVYATGLFFYAVSNLIYACPSINAITNFVQAPA